MTVTNLPPHPTPATRAELAKAWDTIHRAMYDAAGIGQFPIAAELSEDPNAQPTHDQVENAVETVSLAIGLLTRGVEAVSDDHADAASSGGKALS